MYLLLTSTGFLLALLTDYVEPSCYSPPSDVCSHVGMSEIPSLESRDPSVILTNATSNWTFCDVYAIDTNQWYKSESNMSTSCPSMYMCGAKFPIWMNGTNPGPEDGLVNRTSCLKDFDNCCLIKYRLTAVNCGSFMAYCFVDLPSGCHQRYCFDNGVTSTTKPTQTPTLNVTSTTATQKVTGDVSTKTSEKPTTDSALSSCFSATSDICNHEMTNIPGLESRSTSYMINNITSHWRFCDVYAIDTNKWYKSESEMTTGCPSMYSCGTKFPIWMNGKNPSPEDGLVHRTSCLRDFENCCLIKYRLTAVNCGGFMAYCFVDLPSGCHQRYCFDYTPPSTTPPISSTTDLETGISTEDSQTPKPVTPPSNDAPHLTIALAVIGLLTVTMFGLLIIIIRRKRNLKIKDKVVEDKGPYDTLKPPTVDIIDSKETEHVYRTLQFVNPVLGDHGKEQLKETHVYAIPFNPYSTVAHTGSETLADDGNDLYDEDNHYVKLP